MEHGYKTISQSKYIILLAMLYTVANTVPTLFLYRFIKIGGLVLPGGMLIFPLIYMISDVVSEVYGYRMARLFIWYGVLCNFVFALFVLSVIYLPAPPGLPLKDEYYNVFHSILHGDIANFVGVIIGNTLNIYALSKWKVLLRGKYFMLRSLSANIVGEAIMLIIWGFIAFHGRLPFPDIAKLIGSDYLVRVIYAVLVVVPAAILVNYLKKQEQIDVYDYSTNFNPFKLSLKE